jgi:hypothetical protein
MEFEVSSKSERNAIPSHLVQLLNTVEMGNKAWPVNEAASQITRGDDHE